jgi:predicted MPP superfamily phosphohydrolase
VSDRRSSSAGQAVRRIVGLDTEVQLREWTVWIPNLSEAHDGLRVAHLSDVHVGLVTPDRRIRNAVELIAAVEPDLCVLTGDFASRRPEPLERLGRVLKGLPDPTFFVLGNHDHRVDAAKVTTELEGIGYVHLDNRHHTVEFGGEPLHLIGLDDPVTRRHRPAQAVAGLPEGGTRLLLAHQAESLVEVLALGQSVDLCVSGHTHGGQIYLPGLTDRMMAKVGLRHVRGLRRLDDVGPWLHVTRGVGSAVMPLRVASRPEVGLLTLRRDRTESVFAG